MTTYRVRPSTFTRRVRPAFEIDRRAEIFDIALVSAVFVAIVFNLVIGPLTPLIVVGVVAIFAVLRWERIWPLLSRNWPLLCLPLLAIFSVLWSQAPGATLRYGTLYLITSTCGVILGGGLSQRSFLKGSFAALFFYSVVALLIGRYVTSPAGPAFAGVLGSKNASGDIAGISLLASLAIFLWAWPRQQLHWLMAGLVGLPMCGYILWQSRATGALIATAVATSCMLLWSASARAPAQVRVTLFVVVIGAMLALLATWSSWMPIVFDALLAESGKDSGLTGRADLWRKADELITAKPWLGQGYNAFWVQNNLEAEYLWRIMGITNREGFNFHNTGREILVDLGIVGLASFLLISIIYAGVLLVRTMIEPTAFRIAACTYLVFFIPKVSFELVGFTSMHFSTIMVFALLAAGTQRRDPAGAKSPSRKPNPADISALRHRSV